MRITKVKLNNYVCFFDAPEFELGPGINFVVGKNNSGKTVLLDVLSHEYKGQPYRSEDTINHLFPGLTRQQTRYAIVYEFEQAELLRILSTEQDSFFLPLAPGASSTANHVRWFMPDGFLTDPIDYITYLYQSHHATHVKLADDTHELPVNGEQAVDCYRAYAVSKRVGDSWQVKFQVPDRTTHSVRPKRTAWAEVACRIPQYQYRFVAERRIGAVADVEEDTVLKGDASNLASVLCVLKASSMDSFLQSVQHVVPEIRELLFKPGSGTVELQLSFYPSGKSRDDLAISLDKCGTGVGQILAMLYVVLFYDKSQPRVIIIDEPNSFLHPGAVRKLLEIFQEHDHHQYIIATHSPAAIMSVQKKHILLVTRENMVSSVKSVNVHDNTELEEMLREIGSSRSDIFGMDAYIWVEGKTDRICLNLVMDKHGGLPAGAEIIELVHTGDFDDKKRGALIEQIYARLSGSVGILPSALAFVFDGDLQNDDFAETDTRKFLPRQNFESFLIYPEILADILNRDAAEDKPKDYTSDTVESWIRDQEGKSYDDVSWLKSVDGAKLLDRMFQELAGISYENYKVEYGEEITRRILADNPSHFKEIVDLISSILDKANQPDTT